MVFFSTDTPIVFLLLFTPSSDQFVFRNEMLHDMRVSKKNQSKLVSFNNLYIFCQVIAGQGLVAENCIVVRNL